MNLTRLPLTIIANRLGRTPRPSWCTYLVTFRCNARCKMCDSWRMKPGSELTPAQVGEVFRKVGSLDVVRLTGGEPFLRDDFAEVAHAVLEASSPGVVHITTNGSFPDRIVEFAQKFAAPRRLRFMVSFDGLPEEHDANRGADVTFSLAEETVRRLKALSPTIPVSVNHTIISASSLEAHTALKARFEAMGVDVHWVLAYADSAMYGLKRFGSRAYDLIPSTGYPLHPKLEGADAAGFARRELRHLAALRDPVLRVGKRYYVRGLLSRLLHEPSPSPKPPCVALRSHLRILPDGRVPVCQFNTETVGNLLHQSMDELWHAEETRRQRAWVDACPGCWAECEVMPSAIYSGDLLQVLRPTTATATTAPAAASPEASQSCPRGVSRPV
jgi:MoaA/NifB/PqqE/SkfB family radical SAM enzyme